MNVVEIVRELIHFPNNVTMEWRRVGYKQAWVSNLLRKRYYLIKSYETIVGLVDMEEMKFYEIGKYSPTTSKQITQIHNSMFQDCDRMFIDGRV